MTERDDLRDQAVGLVMMMARMMRADALTISDDYYRARVAEVGDALNGAEVGR